MRENAVVIAIGQTGSGKTTKIRELADQARRAIIADPEGKWRSGPRAGPELEVRTGPELLAALEAAGAADPATAFRIVYRGDDAERMEVAAPAAAFAYRNLTLVFDEIVWICSGRRCPVWLKRVVQVGRERRINLLLTTREPQEIPDLLLSQSSVRWLFRMDPGNGRERVSRYYKIPEAELEALAPYLYRICGDPDSVAWVGREGLTIPQKRRSSRRSVTRQR